MHPRTFVDQMGNAVTFSAAPKRIVSLVPSQTELLFDLGLDEHVIGITKYCVHPSAWKSTKAIVGGTKNFDVKAIERLQPDLIIANREENTREGIEALQKKFHVWVSEIYNIEDALSMIEGIGLVTGKSKEALHINEQVRRGFKILNHSRMTNALYLIWRKPWMAAGQNTFINAMIQRIGFNNCLPVGSRYPELSRQDLVDLHPEFVLLSSEPYPFSEKHIDELQEILPEAKIVLVDGEMFSWYGSRMIKAVEYLKGLGF